MAKYEIDTDKGTVKKINDGKGCLFIIILFCIFAFFGGNAPEEKIDYWKGDRNCPLFTERDDGSMVVFRKDSVQELVGNSRTNKVILFRGYEVDSEGNFIEYGYYGVLYNTQGTHYEVIYPQTANFPEGQKFKLSNEYQINVCKVMIKAAADHDKLQINH